MHGTTGMTDVRMNIPGEMSVPKPFATQKALDMPGPFGQALQPKSPTETIMPRAGGPPGINTNPGAPAPAAAGGEGAGGGEGGGTVGGPSWSGAWDALKGGNIADAWGNLPDAGKGFLGGGGLAILLLLLSRLFGKRGEESYSPGEIQRARDILDRLSGLEKAGVYGEAMACRGEIEKMACSLAKRYSKTVKPTKRACSTPACAKAKRYSRTFKPKQAAGKQGQFQAGHRFQGAKTAAEFGKYAAMDPILQNTLSGAGLGGGTGALLSVLFSRPENRVRNALKGGVVGAGIGGSFGLGRATAPPKADAEWGPEESLTDVINRIIHQREMVERASKMKLPPPQGMEVQGSAAHYGKRAANFPYDEDGCTTRDLMPIEMADHIENDVIPSLPPCRFVNDLEKIAAMLRDNHTLEHAIEVVKGCDAKLAGYRASVWQERAKNSGVLDGIDKESTWVTRNGKRVHIKHKKKRKKKAEEEKKAKSIAVGTAARSHVAKSDFTYKSKAPKGTSKSEAKGKYPVPDKQHARSALGFAAMHHGKGSAEYQAVKAKGKSKFGDMGKESAAALYKEAVIPWRGPVGAVAGGAGGAGLGALIKLLLAKAGAPGMQDLPYGMGVYEPALVGMGLGGGLGLGGDLAASRREGMNDLGSELAAKQAAVAFGIKLARDMPSFTSQDRPAKVKEIYRALKRDHPGMSAG